MEFLMKITKIERQKKDPMRYSIYVDENFLLGIHENVLLDNALYKDQEITAEQIQTLKSQEQQSKMYQRALNYISYQMRSIKEVRDYLAKQMVSDPQQPDNEISIDANVQQQIIDKLMQQGYLNDRIYAESYVRNQSSIQLKSPRNIEQDLIKKGLSQTEILHALDAYSQEEQVMNASELAKKFIRRQKRLTPKLIQTKLQQYLYTKGYERDIIQHVVDMSDTGKEEEEIIDLLELDAAKSLKKRQRKYTGYQLKQQIIQDLIRKGHDYDNINFWLEDNQEEIMKEADS